MLRRLLASMIAIIALTITASPAGAAVDASGSTGAVRFVKRMTPAFDPYVTNPSAERTRWLNAKLWRTEVFTPFFDSRTSFYGKGWLYSDIYAIYAGSDVAAQHPEWILKDGAGRKLFIPWGCSNGTCPQYAADITNPQFRSWWTANLVRNLAKGYRGAWVDDVNLEMRVGDGNGTTVAPFSAALGRTMSDADWRRAMAEFTEQVRAAVPADKELLHNSIWYAGQGVGRDADPYVARQIAAADYINIERGFNDDGLTAGSGEWSVRALQSFIDRVHAKGKGVIIDAFDASQAGMEYSLANYLLINTGRDGVGQIDMTPDNWWSGWDTDLGIALSERYDWQGLQRRDFTGGLVLTGDPGAPARTVALPSAMTTIDGRTVTSVTVGGGRGVVLRGTGSKGTPSGPGTGAPATPAPVATPQPTPAPAANSCVKTRITYPTLRWDAKKRRLVPARGSVVVCIPAGLGARARRAAVKKARVTAARSSKRQAHAARRAMVQAEAARSR